MITTIETTLAGIDQNMLTAAFVIVVYLLARHAFHFRAWNVHNIKTNPRCNWRSSRKSIGSFYMTQGQVQVLNKIEDFCLMVLRVRYRNEIRVKLYDETGETVFGTRVWVPKINLTPVERLTKSIHGKGVHADGKLIGVVAGKRFLVPAKNLLEKVWHEHKPFTRFTSNVIPEMIVLKNVESTNEVAKAAVKDRRAADRKFVERHFRRAAWSYFLAYGTCVPLRTFFPTKRYSARYHDFEDEALAF